jgi:predicted heme/steroid binding protein
MISKRSVATKQTKGDDNAPVKRPRKPSERRMPLWQLRMIVSAFFTVMLLAAVVAACHYSGFLDDEFWQKTNRNRSKVKSKQQEVAVNKPTAAAARWHTDDIPHLFASASELTTFNGANKELPLLLSILGVVYDVSEGNNYYGVDAGNYHFFAGRDASRSFVTCCFDLECFVDHCDGLDATDRAAIEEWAEFYRTSPKYHFVGYIDDVYRRYHGAAAPPNGPPTPGCAKFVIN